MTTLDACPHCGASLQGDPIPSDQVDFFGAAHFRREIGVTVLGVYEGALYWTCPDCLWAWNRWPEDTPQHHLAAPYIAHTNRKFSTLVGAA